MQILNRESQITQTVPRIVETPEYLIINSQVHDKTTLKPIPLQFNVVNAPLIYSSLDRCIWTYDNNNANRIFFLHYGNGKYQKLHQDITDANVFYALLKYPDYGVKFIKFKKDKDNVTEIWQETHNINVGKCNSASYGCDINILYQTDLYILYALKVPYQYDSWYAGEYYYLRKYNKKTNQVVNITNYGMGTTNAAISNYQFMEYYNDNVYLYRQAGIAHEVYVVNLSTNLYTKLFTFSSTGGCTVIDNPVKIGDYYYVIKDNYPQSGLHEYCFHKIRLDVKTDTVTEEIVDINLNGFVLDTANGQVLSGVGEGVYHTLKTLNTNGKTYIICTVHATPNINYYPNQHKNIVFEVTDTEITVKDVIVFPNGCKGVMEYIDSNILMFLYTDSIAFYKFDNTREKYVMTYKKGGVFNMVGFDTLNRFYMQYNTNAIEVITSMNACILKTDFKEECYTSINKDTEIYFYAKNFLDEYLNTDVRITLIGPVQFKDGTKQVITKTSDKGMETLPVRITGSGRIEVVITQLTES
jgi:hypothetical protein